jgi:fibronectin type 3 domain-containing protein
MDGFTRYVRAICIATVAGSTGLFSPVVRAEETTDRSTLAERPNLIAAWRKGGVQVSWEKSTTSGVYFVVSRKSKGEREFKVIASRLNEASTVHFDSDLTPGTTYVYRVVARDAFSDHVIFVDEVEILVG